MKNFLKYILVWGVCSSAIAQTPAQLESIKKGKELFGDLKARHIGPALMSGRVTDIETHPKNDRIVYIGTAGGGVWKSNNGGATFNSIFDEYCQSIGAVELDPNDPDNVIWVGTGEVWTRNSVSIGDGLYRSKDGGSSWEKMGFENSERISSIQVNPKNSLEVYVGVLGPLWSDSESRGLYKTTDGGKTWTKLLYVDQTTGCSDLQIDAEDPSVLYASFWEFRRSPWSFSSGGDKSALYKTTDAGKTWNKIHNGFPKGKLGRLAIAIASSNNKILYTVVESEQDKDKGLYRSDDAGATWKQLNNDFGLVVRPFYFSRIVVDPRNPNIVVKAGLSGSISRDGGKTFKNLGPMHSDIHDIAFDIKNSDRMYAATDGGVYRSWDGGTTMEMVENLPLSQFYHVSVDDKDDYNVYGGLQDNGCWFGPSRSPGGIEARDWRVVGVGDGYRVYRHPTKNLIYSEMQGAENVWRYDPVKDQAKTIQPLQMKGEAKLRFNWNASLVTSPNKADRVYIGSQFVHRSDDMGETWTKISPDLSTNDPKKQNQENSGGLSKDNSGAENHCTIFTIAESPVNENVIWVGTDDGNLQITKDGGKSWTNVIKNIQGLPKNTWAYHVEASVFGASNAYVVFNGYTTGNMNTYVYKTSDYGATWKSIVTPEIYGFARNIQEDYVNENLLFLGTEFGLHISLNGGANWYRFTNNFPAVNVHYIELHKKTNDLVIATHGRGVIIIDDISILRQLTEENMSKDLFFFNTKPTSIVESNGFGGSSTETQFVGENPSSAARIIYHLNKKHLLGKMTLEIQDANGAKVAEIGPGKSKGINIVEWYYNSKPPKVAQGKTFAFGGFTSPRVPAGTYKVVITKGKEKYSNDLVIQYDPKSEISLADRKIQESITMKLYNMSQELAYMVYSLDEYIKFIEKQNSTNADFKKTSNAFVADLNKLKGTLVVTTGDNYVGAAENQLREDLVELYSKIAQTYHKPNKAELDNLDAIESKFNTGKTEFAKIKDKYLSKVEKLAGTTVALKTYEEYLLTP